MSVSTFVFTSLAFAAAAAAVDLVPPRLEARDDEADLSFPALVLRVDTPLDRLSDPLFSLFTPPDRLSMPFDILLVPETMLSEPVLTLLTPAV